MTAATGTGQEVEVDLVLRIHATNSRRPLPEPGPAQQHSPVSPSPSLHANLAGAERQASFDSPVIGRRAGNAGGSSVGVGLSEARRGDDMVRDSVAAFATGSLVDD